MLIPWAAAGICLCLCLCLGCGKEPSTPTILDQRAQPFVQDIPVPRNFELEGRKSDHKIIAGRRTVSHFYLGSEDLLAVRNFYVHYMPLSQWQIVNERLHAGVYVLNYKKNDEKCEIRIERIPAGVFGKPTQVHAVVRSLYAVTPTD